MGKQGPCRHCGVTSTPLWRNGPPDKPVLCNACGSRWRTKGSLVNYTPLHVREVLDSEELKPVPVKLKTVTVPIKKEQQQKIKILPKRKPNPNPNPRVLVDNEPFSGQNFKRENSNNNNTNINNNNRASSYSGSAVSYSESCAPYDASDLTGSSQSNMWDPLVPSKKRTGVPRPKPSRVEKLTKDLYTILHETPLSHLSNPSEELFYPQNTMDSTDSIEIGSGSVLIRNQKSEKSKSVEEESEASSVPDRSCVSGSAGNGGVQLNGASPAEIVKKPSGVLMTHENAKRDSANNEKQPVLRVADSALSSLDLKDIINFESFMKYLTNEEQKQLIKVLPITDTIQPPTSLRSMFSSPQFVKTLNNFQKLLKEGVFNLTLAGANSEECKTLKKLVLTNPLKSKWVEFYKQIKEKDGQNKNDGKKGPVTSVKRPHDAIIDNNHLGSNVTMRSPKRIQKLTPSMDLEANSSSKPKPSDSTKGHFGLFLSPADRRSPVNVPIKYTDDFSNQDLLLDIPSNSSFPEAELLKLVPNEESQSSCGISNYGNKQPRLR